MANYKIISILVISFVFFGFIRKNRDETPEDFRVKTRRLAIQKAKEISKKYDIYLGGHGLAAMYEVEKISLYFHRYRQLDVEEGRKIIVAVTKELIEFFNEQTDLSCHYKNYPLTLKNFYIALFSISPYGKIYAYPNIDRVINSRGDILYASFDPEDHNKHLWDKEKRETFEEAVQILSQG